MKAILEFSLPEEEVEFNAANQGRRLKAALWGIDQRLRSLLKYGEPTPAQASLAEEIRQAIPFDLLED